MSLNRKRLDDPYAGRWIARLRGRIIAQGGTPEQARQAALSRYKETPEILFQPLAQPLPSPPLLKKIGTILPPKKDVFLVGGAVRDLFLGRQIHDYDFALKSGGLQIARRVADALGGDFYPLDDERDTGRVLLWESPGMRLELDFASFRGATLEADLLGRDFTVNAMAIHLKTGALYDPLGARQDLAQKVLKACSPDSLMNDPVRILRAVRLAADYGFHIDKDTRNLMKESASALACVSSERVRDELFRILNGKNPAACLRALEMIGAVPVILPELTGLKGLEQPEPHQHEAWEHTLAVLESLQTILTFLAPKPSPDLGQDVWKAVVALRIGRYREQLSAHLDRSISSGRSDRSLLFLAALLHDVGKPLSRQADEAGQLHFWGHDQQGADLAASRGRALALSNEEVELLDTLVRHHMRLLFHINRFHTEGRVPSRRAVYRFFRDAGKAGVDLCLLALADLRATHGQILSEDLWQAALDVVRLFLENWFEKPDESIAPPALVDGNDIMLACRLEPGPRVGELLEAIREGQAIGEITSRKQALEFARRLCAQG